MPKTSALRWGLLVSLVIGALTALPGCALFREQRTYALRSGIEIRGVVTREAHSFEVLAPRARSATLQRNAGHVASDMATSRLDVQKTKEVGLRVVDLLENADLESAMVRESGEVATAIGFSTTTACAISLELKVFDYGVSGRISEGPLHAFVETQAIVTDCADRSVVRNVMHTHRTPFSTLAAAVDVQVTEPDSVEAWKKTMQEMTDDTLRRLILTLFADAARETAREALRDLVQASETSS